MSGFGFGNPLWLVLAPVALALGPLALALAERSARRARALTRQPPGPRRAGVVALALAVALAAVAAAQPRWGERTVAVPTGGARVVAVLDVSRSMGVTDVAPSRLAASRAAVAGAFRALSGDRAALIVFAGDARVRFPLTRDLDAAAVVVENVRGGALLLERGTSAAAGLDLARELLDDGDGRAGGLVLLVSDGDDLGGDPAASAAALADAGIALLVAGAGTPVGGAVPVFDPVSGERSVLTDAGGAPVVSRLVEARLRAIAEAAGGRYLGADPAIMPGAVRARIAALDGGERDVTEASLPIERFQWFAAAALALALLGTAIEWRVPFRWRGGMALALAAALALLASACATVAHDLNERAREALAAGDVDAAVALLYEARAEAPADGRIALNLAAALHHAGRHEEGARAARLAAAHRDVAIAAAGHASLGRHLFALGALDASLEAFGEALLLAPEDDVARRDYEVVLRLLRPPPPAAAAPAPSDGDGEPPDGEPPASQPGAGADGASGGGADGGEGLAPAELEARLAALDARVAELRAEAGETLGAEEALAILDLLAERARLAAANAVRARWSDAGDY